MHFRPCLIATFLATVCLAAQGEKDPDGLQEFKSEEGGFSVLLPKVVEPSVNGSVHLLTAKSEQGDLFIVGYADFDEAEIKEKTPVRLIDSGVEDFLSGIKAKPMDRVETTLEGSPGVAVFFRLEDGRYGALRDYMVKNREYQLIFIGLSGKDGSQACKRFLNSFRLLKKG